MLAGLYDQNGGMNDNPIVSTRTLDCPSRHDRLHGGNLNYLNFAVAD